MPFLYGDQVCLIFFANVLELVLRNISSNHSPSIRVYPFATPYRHYCFTSPICHSDRRHVFAIQHFVLFPYLLTSVHFTSSPPFCSRHPIVLPHFFEPPLVLTKFDSSSYHRSYPNFATLTIAPRTMSLDSFPTLESLPPHNPPPPVSSLARSSSLDPSTAIPNVSLTESASDAWLWRVLQNERNRQMIARLEDTLHSFVCHDDQPSLAFPPRNRFHRRVCFAVARRYGLDHRLEASEPAYFLSSSSSSSSSDNLRLVLVKTPNSAPPPTRLAAFADGPPPPAPPAPPALHTVASTSCIPSESAFGSMRLAPSASSSSDGEVSQIRPATFLRKPRPNEGSIVRPHINAGAQTKAVGAAAGVRRMTEEDYEKYVVYQS